MILNNLGTHIVSSLGNTEQSFCSHHLLPWDLILVRSKTRSGSSCKICSSLIGYVFMTNLVLGLPSTHTVPGTLHPLEQVGCARLITNGGNNNSLLALGVSFSINDNDSLSNICLGRKVMHKILLATTNRILKSWSNYMTGTACCRRLTSSAMLNCSS